MESIVKKEVMLNFKLFHINMLLILVPLQKYFIFKEIYGKDSDKQRLLITKINLLSHERGNNRPFKYFHNAIHTASHYVMRW